MTKPKTSAVALFTALGLLLAPIAALADDAAPKTDTNSQNAATDNSGGDSQQSNDSSATDAAADVIAKCGQAMMAIGIVHMMKDCKQSDD